MKVGKSWVLYRKSYFPPADEIDRLFERSSRVSSTVSGKVSDVAQKRMCSLEREPRLSCDVENYVTGGASSSSSQIVAANPRSYRILNDLRPYLPGNWAEKEPFKIFCREALVYPQIIERFQKWKITPRLLEFFVIQERKDISEINQMLRSLEESEGYIDSKTLQRVQGFIEKRKKKLVTQILKDFEENKNLFTEILQCSEENKGLFTEIKKTNTKRSLNSFLSNLVLKTLEKAGRSIWQHKVQTLNQKQIQPSSEISVSSNG